MTNDDPLLAAVAAERDDNRDVRWLAAVEAALEVHTKTRVAAVLGMRLSNFTARLSRTRDRVNERNRQ